MKTIFALMIGLAVGFFFGRAGAVPVGPPPLGASAPAGSTASAPLPSPMSNPAVRPAWKARAEPAASGAEAERRASLSQLTEADIEEWRALRRQRKEQFLKTNPEYWHAGRTDGAEDGSRIDAKVLQTALGSYEGTMRYELRERPGPATYKFQLSINSADGSRENSLVMSGGRNNEKGRMSATFKWEFLGTEGRDVNVVWFNYSGDEQRFASDFAFRLRGGMNPGDRESVPLAGLGPDLKWQEIGTLELRRIK